MKERAGLLSIVLSLCFLSQAAAAALADGLVLHYTFDSDEGGAVTDASGNGRTARVNGAAWVPAGARGGAYRFDSNSQNILATDAGLPAGDSPRSVALWLKTDKESQEGCTSLLGYGTDNFNKQFTGIGFDWRQDRDRVYFTPGGSCFLTESRLPPAGTWLHIAYTYGGNGAHHLYFDGSPNDGMSEMSGRLNTVLSGRLLLGGYPGSAGPDGAYLDDVRIYDRALSPGEVAQLAGGARQGAELPEAALAAAKQVFTEPAAAEPPIVQAQEVSASGDKSGGKPLPGGFPLGFLAGACFAGVLAYLISKQPKKSDAAN